MARASTVMSMILLPSLITLAVSLLRLTGEMLNWPSFLFRKSAGGFGAIVGITWLAIFFAIYFAIKLEKRGDVLDRPSRSIVLAILALVLAFAGPNIMYRGYPELRLTTQIIGAGIVIAGLGLMRATWESYWKIMMAYAVAARIPVIVIMYFAVRGNWGTHYDVAPPDVTFADWGAKFVQIALIPQLFLWIPFTVVLCGLFGIIIAAVRRRWVAA